MVVIPMITQTFLKSSNCHLPGCPYLSLSALSGCLARDAEKRSVNPSVSATEQGSLDFLLIRSGVKAAELIRARVAAH